MRMLILGGTVFLSKAMASEALARGHDVTCVSRGTSGDPPEDASWVRADRDDPDALLPLAADTWDAVVDVTRTPAHARSAVAVLGKSTEHWTYVSTCSVYADEQTPGQDESAPLLEPAEPEPGESAMARYGEFKVACEHAVVDGFPGAVLLARPGLIIGPEDPSGRFAYWVRRIVTDDRVIAPGAPDDSVQFIDVRDLAAWLVTCAERRLAGAFTTISEPMPRAEFLDAVARGVRRTPEWVWADQDTLRRLDVEPWMGERSIPMWLPLPDYAGFMTRDVSAALSAGLAVRPLEHTARDTLTWLETAPDAARTGLTDSEHAELLQAVTAAEGA